jgi:hypothetical protein
VTSTAVTSAPVNASASVETSAEARPAARRESPCGSSMIKAAECAGMGTRLNVRRKRSMRRRSPTETPTPALAPAVEPAAATKPAGMSEVPTPAIEGVAIDEDSAAGDVGVVVVDDVVVVPVKSPVVPSPTKSAKKERLEAEAKNHTRTR